MNIYIVNIIVLCIFSLYCICIKWPVGTQQKRRRACRAQKAAVELFSILKREKNEERDATVTRGVEPCPQRGGIAR